MFRPMSSREPILHPVPIKDLRPTQITVGFREVAEKRKEWRERQGKEAPEFLGRHMIPALLGPKERYYVIDHHHLVRALHDEGVKHVLVTVVADLRVVHSDSFWIVLDHRGWCHPYDDDGRRRSFDQIPPGVSGLKDDPYRSLAGALRRAGGFAKEVTPFSEFIWADFLRRNVKRKRIETDFTWALTKALELAKSADASYLPGWCGPIERE
jgi:hypothetical protein